MSPPLFPLAISSEEIRLLTGLLIGMAFGFSLERGGFGNARKLAGQFYLHDMTVFKVMFTAILTAMVGLYTLAGLGLVDLPALWINPTFLPAQVVGGFLLGVGFIMSGLCPGTAVVSAVSGRIDAVVALAGIFLGTWLFALAVGAFPGLLRLYEAGSLGVSTLPDLLRIPAPLLVLIVVAVAGLAFIGAEAVERRFQARRAPVELTPAGRPLLKFAVAGGLALVVVAGAAARPARPGLATRPVPVAGEIEPLALAERIMARDPGLVILALDRGDSITAASMAGAIPAAGDTPPGLLARAGTDDIIVLLTADGRAVMRPAAWPAGLDYRVLRGGWDAWRHDVLTLAAPGARPSVEESARVARQHQIAAWFTGAAPATVAAPSAPAPAAGPKPPKKGGGC